MKIAIGSDHAGYRLKEEIKKRYAKTYEWRDLGAHSEESVDYPDFAASMAGAIAQGEAVRGILICGSGIGISIAANRFPVLRAALCTSEEMARLARAHNDANVLVLGGRIIDFDTAMQCVDAFMKTPFEGGRHQRRVDKLNGSVHS